MFAEEGPMHAFRGAFLRLRGLFSGGRVERELEDELRFHLDMEAEKEASRGVDANEARRRALVRFGGVERFREDSRQASGLGLRDALLRDGRVALRALVKT